MESLGQCIKEAREHKDITIQKIAEDTNIAKKYLIALENEEFSVFPGEAYLKGFLRTYCQYLGLDPDDMVSHYERLKISEQPVPIEQLIPKPKMNLRPLITILLLIVVLGGLITGGFFLTRFILKNRNNGTIVTNTTTTTRKEIEGHDTRIVLNESDEKVLILHKGDIIEVKEDDAVHKITVKELSPTVILLDENNKDTYLFLGATHSFDLDNDKKNDLEIVLNFWDDKEANVTASVLSEGKETTEITESYIPAGETETIVTKSSKEVIDISVLVKSRTYIRYKIDEEPAVEQFFERNSNIPIQADDQVVLWTSNAGVIDLNFTSYDKVLTPGSIGYVEVSLIRWNKKTKNEYELQISSLE